MLPGNTFIFFQFKKKFNLKIIALQCCLSFCHTTMQISYNYVCVCVYLLPLKVLQTPVIP